MGNCCSKMSKRCDFCGRKDNVKTYKVVPELWRYNTFCNDKKCAEYYDNYVYDRDLSKGIPFSVRVRRSQTRSPCTYCCKIGDNVIMTLDTSSRFMHLAFCQNERCFNSYCERMR